MAAVVPWPVPGSSQRLAGQPMRFLSAAMAEEESEQAGLCKHFSIFCFALRSPTSQQMTQVTCLAGSQKEGHSS